jgi:predicted metal-binding membrane protein
VMMAGMMLPSALPMILTFATINRRKRTRGQPHVATSVFVTGYLVAWGGFSVAATAAQWGLEQGLLMTPMGMSTSTTFGGVLLIGAGLYQFTPLKHACLRHCRSPFDFVLNRWRDGRRGALAMGVEHGLYCLGCCWLAMALLFVFGVMNLLWIATLAVLVLAEKVVPGGPWIARASGVAMIAAGAYRLAS